MKTLMMSVVACLVVGCSKPPMQIPSHFEGTVGNAVSEKDILALEMKQDGRNISGDYVWSRSGALSEFKGPFKGTVSGPLVSLSLDIPDEAQKKLGWETPVPVTVQLGEIARSDLLVQFKREQANYTPKELLESTPLPILRGNLELSGGGQKLQRMVVLYNLHLFPK